MKCEFGYVSIWCLNWKTKCLLFYIQIHTIIMQKNRGLNKLFKSLGFYRQPKFILFSTIGDFVMCLQYIGRYPYKN